MTEKPVVLIVDDLPENIQLLTGLLRGSYRIQAASDGERALKIASGDVKPELILLDTMLPGMDGYQICQALQANPETRKIPVVFISARTEEEDMLKSLAAGAVDHLVKPISPRLLSAKIAALFRFCKIQAM